ncbi:hypothetical protein [Salinivibrio sp. IB872]|uniref:hypothetical protein n=1 Tax=Salinivibrio sp. IB872 TaxID=1766123 RepID=UPI000986FBB4|nr:hypothetical protein [Salinivibrio sp. IB872]OOF22975.1 hypothetical protein BZJ18_14645 [Salinivibrio sp. IB872]
MKSLLEHRENLKNNVKAYEVDIERCYRTVVKHLKDVGYKRITFNRAESTIKQFVELIFEAQHRKPFFHIESPTGLPYCWNSPSKNGWDIDYIKYEWGHHESRNQNGDAAHCAQNLCLQSARCNQHIQSSMNVNELKEYGGKLEQVIDRNLENRRKLFSSDEWKNLLMELDRWK